MAHPLFRLRSKERALLSPSPDLGQHPVRLAPLGAAGPSLAVLVPGADAVAAEGDNRSIRGAWRRRERYQIVCVVARKFAALTVGADMSSTIRVTGGQA